MYQKLLDEFNTWRKRYDELPQAPCSPDGLAQLRQRSQSELGHAVPDAYLEFLGRTNGFDGNGLVLYAASTTPIAGFTDRSIEGFVDANLGWWDYAPNRRYLFFGESGQSMYVLVIETGQYEIRDRQSDSFIETQPSFDALVHRALEQHRPPS